MEAERVRKGREAGGGTETGKQYTALVRFQLLLK